MKFASRRSPFVRGDDFRWRGALKSKALSPGRFDTRRAQTDGRFTLSNRGKRAQQGRFEVPVVVKCPTCGVDPDAVRRAAIGECLSELAEFCADRVHDRDYVVNIVQSCANRIRALLEKETP